MNKNLLIIGTSTTAIHVYNFVKEYKLYNILGFAVDRDYLKDNLFLGLPVYAIDELEQKIDKESDLLFVAMLWNKLNLDRKNTFEQLKNKGFSFANLISPTAKVRGKLIGENCWIHDYVIVQNDAIIGTNVVMMAFTLIGAHCEISSHCFFGAKSTVGGGCTIGEQTFVGINTTIFDDRVVGRKCIVGACTALKRDLPDYSSCKTDIDSMVIKTYDDNIIENKLIFSENRH